MKKNLFFFVLIIILSFSLLLGCQREEKQGEESISESSSEKENELMEEPINDILVYSSQEDPRKREETLTKLASYPWDLDGDGFEEKIELYTAAERYEVDGSMLWDDGQNWLLLVEDEEQYYPLLHQYVQLGLVYFNVWLDDKEIPNITVFVSTHTNLNIINYTYDREEKAYIGKPVYDTGVINFLFSSFPSY